MKNTLATLFLVVAVAICVSLQSATSVVIIGAGPAGLATAIEAKLAGAHTTIIEKRSSYDRLQRLFLFEHSLQLLEKWGVEASELRVMQIGKERIGIVAISALENALRKRAEAVGVLFIQDELIHLSQQKNSILLATNGTLPYDILVAADGTHSATRQALGIEIERISHAKAGAALIPSSESESRIDVSSDMQYGDSFIKKFYFPGMHFMFFQGPFSATKEDLIALCKASGWHAQADTIALDKARLLLDVDVYLQKAKQFFIKEHSALIVGDAAGTATFFRGSGANYAFKTAEIAGHFFQSNDGNNFEARMQKATDDLIEDSAFLFPHSCR